MRVNKLETSIVLLCSVNKLFQTYLAFIPIFFITHKGEITLYLKKGTNELVKDEREKSMILTKTAKTNKMRRRKTHEKTSTNGRKTLQKTYGG